MMTRIKRYFKNMFSNGECCSLNLRTENEELAFKITQLQAQLDACKRAQVVQSGCRPMKKRHGQQHPCP
jgi:hypothetical protein